MFSSCFRIAKLDFSNPNIFLFSGLWVNIYCIIGFTISPFYPPLLLIGMLYPLMLEIWTPFQHLNVTSIETYQTQISYISLEKGRFKSFTLGCELNVVHCINICISETLSIPLSATVTKLNQISIIFLIADTRTIMNL